MSWIRAWWRLHIAGGGTGFFTTEAQRHRELLVGRRGFERDGNGAFSGKVHVFSPPRHRGHREILVGCRGFERDENGAFSGKVQVFSPQRHREILLGGADSSVVGMAHCRGWYRIVSPQRHRGHREILLGWRGFERDGNGAFSGKVHVFSPPRTPRALIFTRKSGHRFSLNGTQLEFHRTEIVQCGMPAMAVVPDFDVSE